MIGNWLILSAMVCNILGFVFLYYKFKEEKQIIEEEKQVFEEEKQETISLEDELISLEIKNFNNYGTNELEIKETNEKIESIRRKLNE